jgi:hypothetical protein
MHKNLYLSHLGPCPLTYITYLLEIKIFVSTDTCKRMFALYTCVEFLYAYIFIFTT